MLKVYSSKTAGTVLLLGLAGFAGASPAGAQINVTVQGNFTRDDDHAAYTFTTPDSEIFSFYTTSYAGSAATLPNADGTVTPEGGFDPLLSLFDGSGNLLGYTDDGAQNLPQGHDSKTGEAYDTYTAGIYLPAGIYTLALTEFDNLPKATLADGFTRDGQGDFTGALYGPGTGAFYDFTGDHRTDAYAFNLTSTSATPAVPEASTTVSFGLLLALGLGGITVAAKRRKSA